MTCPGKQNWPQSSTIDVEFQFPYLGINTATYKVRYSADDSQGVKSMPKVTLGDTKKSEKNIGELIDRIIHDVENDLQVISMEAHVQPSSKREPRCVFDAVANIEKLLAEIRQSFLLVR